MAHKENFDKHKSMLLAEADEIPAEADGDTGGFDMWRYRARPGRDLSCSVGAETRCVRAGRDRSTGTRIAKLNPAANIGP